MIEVEANRIAFAVSAACSGVSTGRLVRLRFMFPDIGKPHVVYYGVLRYPGEKSLVKPDATPEELALPEGLTIHL